jgi:hypothetical protein
MIKHIIPAAIAFIFLAATPAGACDPEDLKAEYRALCATPADMAGELVKASGARLKADVHAQLTAKAKEAHALCLADKYDDGMRLAMRVAKALGAAEQEAGLPREQFTAISSQQQAVAAK